MVWYTSCEEDTSFILSTIVGYLYILDLINAWKMEHIKKSFKIMYVFSFMGL